MKTLAYICAIIGITLSSCSVTYQSRIPYDDVYYSSRHPKPVQAAPAQENPKTTTITPENQVTPGNQGEEQAVYTEESGSEEPSYSTSETYTTPDGTTYVDNNYYYGNFDPDDYYDYGYTSRLRRFHHDWYPGSYWDDYYTNRYWYTYDPWDWGVSIYFGYPWIWPSWSFYDNFTFGWGYYSPWYYNSWNNPYWYSPWYSPWHSWGCSYWTGYWGDYGYYGGPWNYYYNSNDDNTHFGPRQPRNSHSGGIKTGRENISFGDRYDQAIAMENPGKRSTNNFTPDIHSTRPIENTTKGMSSPADPARTNTGLNNDVKGNNSSVINPDKKQATDKGANTPGRVVVPKTNTPVQPNKGVSPKSNLQSQPQKGSTTKTKTVNPYYKPIPPERYKKPKDYSSPNYTKPKSSQEYVSPRNENMGDHNKVAPSGRESNSPSKTYAPEQKRQKEYTPSNERRYEPSREKSNSSDSRGSYSPAPSSSGSSSGRSSGSSGGSSRSSSGSSSGSGKSRR